MIKGARGMALALVLAAFATFGAEDRTIDYANVVPLVLPRADAVYRLDVPQAVYEGVVRPDLGDVRFFNAAGQVVPHGFLPRATTTTAGPERRRLALFPLRAPVGTAVDSLDLRVEKTGDRTRISVTAPGSTNRPQTAVLGYVADAGEKPQPIQALEIEGLAPDTLARVDVDTSDDLRNWRVVVSGAAVANLRNAGATLTQTRIALPSTTARYWRIRGSVAMSALVAEGVPVTNDAPREWKRVMPTTSRAAEGEYEFDVGGRFPGDRLRIELPETNTVASVRVLSRNRSSDPWRDAGGGTVYRLTREGVEVANQELRVAPTGDRLWLLRVDSRGGGIGAGTPALAIGWVPHGALFVARGAPPFSIAFGNFHAVPAAFPVERLLPGHRAGEPIDAPAARLMTAADRSAAEQAAAKEVPVRQPSRPVDYRTWILYAVLVAGVVTLALMAYGLARKMKGDA